MIASLNSCASQTEISSIQEWTHSRNILNSGKISSERDDIQGNHMVHIMVGLGGLFFLTPAAKVVNKLENTVSHENIEPLSMLSQQHVHLHLSLMQFCFSQPNFCGYQSQRAEPLMSSPL